MAEHATMTLEALENLFEQLKKGSIKRAELDKELDDLYFNEHAVEVVESPVLGVEPEVLRMGRIPASMNLIEGLFDEYPVYSLIPLGAGMPAARLTERGEKFLNAVVKQAEREAREDTYGLTVSEALRFGRSFEVVLRADHRVWGKGYPKRGKGQSAKSFNEDTDTFKRGRKLPISIRYFPVEPTNNSIAVFPLMAGSEMIRFIRVYKMLAAEILRRFDHKGQGRLPENLAGLKAAIKAGEGRKHANSIQLTDEFQIIEYYDNTTVVYALMDGKFKGILREWKHGMKANDETEGELPVTIFEGVLTGDRNPAKRWKSIYHDAREVVLHEDRLASRQATNVRINYYKSYFGLAEESNVEGGKGDVIEFEPGKMTILKGLKSFGPVNTETASKEAELLGAKLERMLERHLLPSVLMGVQGASDEPAWGTNLRIRQAERRYKKIANRFAAARVEVGRHVLLAVISIGERVWTIDEDDIEWSLTPDEAKKMLNRIRVKIEPKTIIDRNADVQAAQGQVELGLPRRVIFEDTLGYEQPVELMRERILEDLQFDPNSPLYLKTVEDIMREAGLLDEQEQAATPEDVQQAIAEIGPGGVQAILKMIGMGGNGTGGVPTDFVPGGGRLMLPQEQAKMKTGRRQGRQPRPQKAPRSVRATGG
ncbi:hypothetical protein LCGC14_1186080 [marine sediment metagenome]|uniref:Uncharacterized protein n=1 Tax=marine sediment metagenome TaxID=412755 RepID=A0A0F9PR72_9ZZZZ